MKLSVFGLGKLGSCLLAVLANHHEVIGVDINALPVNLLNKKKAPVVEPGLQKLLTLNADRYRATMDSDEIADTDISFVTVPTPSKEDGSFSNDFVLQAAFAIGQAIRKKSESHLVVIVSTVSPGSTLVPIARSLVLHSGKKLGQGFGLCYSPEFIALGSVIQDLTNPDMLMIGSDSKASGDRLQKVLLGMVNDPKPPVIRLTIPEAEVAKLCVNVAVTMKISFANTLAEICEGIKDVDATNVARAVGSDSRVGYKYLQPATSFGGPCFPRDNQAFLALARSLKTVAPLAEATIDVNFRQMDRLANLVEDLTDLEDTVGILGIAYKPHTPVVDKSIGIELAKELSRRDYSVIVYDPLGMENAKSVLGECVSYASKAEELLDQVKTLVVAQPCREFLKLEPKLGDLVVVDLWKLFKKRECLRPGIFKWGVK